MELYNMKSNFGSRKNKKRIGRGDKTARRGENGQKSRAGYSSKIGFEGGQNPLYRRLPKRGFTNDPFKKVYTIVNLELISKLNIKNVTPEILIKSGMIKKSYGLLKILGKGKLDFPIKISAHKFSKSAKNLIEKAGGSIIIIDPKAIKK